MGKIYHPLLDPAIGGELSYRAGACPSQAFRSSLTRPKLTTHLTDRKVKYR
ncbi:MAG: hypothetical protein IIA60_03530 [Candidatus Marinimicrobia bacterium]|nr:hypothetical protein [Candidatus Neomarinimicrobiota bacterium]